MKNNLSFSLLFFVFFLLIQGCIPLAYTFKEAIPPKIRAQGEAKAFYQLEDPQEIRNFAEKEAHNNARLNLMQKVEKMYLTPWIRVGTLTARNRQAKMAVYNLIRQARVRRTRFIGERKIMVELELDGDKLREVLAPYRQINATGK